MTLTRTVNADGTVHFHNDDPNRTVFFTGPVFGKFTMSDGTVYNATPDAIDLPHPDQSTHVGELSHHIGLHHEEHGHPLHDEDHPFVHLCHSACGELARPIDETVASYQARLTETDDPALIEHRERFTAHLHKEHARHTERAAAADQAGE